MSISLDRIARVDITRATRTASRRSFGTTLIAAYFPTSIWADRVRTYTDPDDMLTDGFGAKHPAYLDAVKLVSQSPRVPSWKVGRRVGAPDQTVRLTPSTPVEAEAFSVKIGGVTFEATADDAPTVAEITAALADQINADADAIIATGASSASQQDLDEADFDGVVGADEISPPRNLVFAHDGNAHWLATTGVVTGYDQNGREIAESFAIPAGLGGGTQEVALTKFFSQVLGVSVPVQGGGAGTFTLGVGQAFAEGTLDVTATDTATHLDVAANNTGDWYAFETPSANIEVEDRTAEPATTLAVDLAAMKAADADWYGLDLADGQSKAQIEAAAAWAETQKIVFFASTMDTLVEQVSDQDVHSSLADSSYLRTLPVYTRASRHGAAAALGRLFPYDVGSADAEYKELAGITADALSETAIEQITGTPTSPAASKRGLVYIEALPAGTNVGTPITYGGLTSGGEWIDVVMGLDFAAALIQERAFNVRVGASKLPFTAGGLDALAGAVRSALNTCAARPYNIFDPASIVVQATPLEDVDAADRQARYYDGVYFDARVQGAIRAFRFRGTVRP